MQSHGSHKVPDKSPRAAVAFFAAEPVSPGNFLNAKFIASQGIAREVLEGKPELHGYCINQTIFKLGSHGEVAHGVKRTQLQQAQFLRAVMKKFNVNIVLGERTGLIDKIGLLSGVLNVQLTVDTPRPQSLKRLTEVHAITWLASSGAGRAKRTRKRAL
jgi:hypothetical protein